MKEYPYWWDTLQKSEVGSLKLDVSLPRRCDVAIVGGGYTGLAAARHLARTGASVAVLERESVGWGASSRNGGQVIAGLRLDPSTLIGRYGEKGARRLFDISLESIDALEKLIVTESIDCEYERSGHLQAAWKPSHFRGFQDEQALLARVFRHPVELVPRAEQRSEIGSDAYFGLMVDPRSGVLNPARYVAGLAAAARRAGAALLEGVGVTRVMRSHSRWTLATTGGDIDAGDVLFATNGYTDGAAPALQRRLVPIGSYIIATEPLEPAAAAVVLPRRRAVFDSKHFLYYFRLATDNRLLFGGRAEFSRPDEASTRRRAASILRTALARVFPDLAGVGIDYAWGGNVAFTRDQMPHAGRLDEAYFAGGYCGHGIAMATYLGTLIARRIAGEQVEHPLMDARFPAIPLYHGNPWFLPFAGAWYRLRDLLD